MGKRRRGWKRVKEREWKERETDAWINGRWKREANAWKKMEGRREREGKEGEANAWKEKKEIKPQKNERKNLNQNGL